MRFKSSALRAAGLKIIDFDPDGYTGAATIAIGSVREHPASAKAFGHQIGVNIVVNKVAGCGHLRPGLPIGQVAARVGRGCIKLQRLKRQILEVGHGEKVSV